MTKRLGGLLAVAVLAALGCSTAARMTEPRMEFEAGAGGVTEILVIERKEEPPAAGAGAGRFTARLAGGDAPLRLLRMDVQAQVTLALSAVTVSQRYCNPFDVTVEAAYEFPLPEDAAVREFVMSIGERRIRGILRGREEALAIYRAALRQGYTATLLTQDRPRVFAQRIANIEPGREIDVRIVYFHALRCAGGAFEFAFPLARPEGGAALDLRIDAGSPIESISSPSHEVLVERPGPARARVTLDPRAPLPERDFVLRWGTAGRGLRGGLAAHRDESGGFFALVLEPPAESPALTDIRIDWGRMEASDLHPDPLPDLPAGRSLTVTGRFRGRGAATVRVQGKASGRPCETAIEVNLDEPALGHPAAASVWARARIASLQGRPGGHAEEIREVALRHGLLCELTAFVTVDSLARAADKPGREK